MQLLALPTHQQEENKRSSSSLINSSSHPAMKRFRFEEEEGEVDSTSSMASALMLLSRGGGIDSRRMNQYHPVVVRAASPAPDKVFECKTCSRQFPSFQALGGHRASHKRPRLLGEDGQEIKGAQGGKPRVHECSVCGLEFAIGQALGGHMRRHRAAAAAATDQGSFGRGIEEKKAGGGKRVLWLDLNLPPMEEEADWKNNLQLALKLVV